MFKKNSWIVALLVALSFSALFIGCIDPLVAPPEDKGAYTEFELTEFNVWGDNTENQAGWATDGSKSKGKPVKNIGLTVEMLQQARYLVVEVNDGFPKNNFETIYDSFDAAGNRIGDWQQFSSITSSGGVLNPGMGERTGNTLKLPMEKILKNYSTNFMDSSVTEIHLIIQHWGNGGTGACIKSAKLLISDEPPPFNSATDITLPGADGSFTYQKEFSLSAATVAPSYASKQKILWSIRKWVSGDGLTKFDLDLAGTNLAEIAKAKAGIKGKVDFKTTYNENDEATQGRAAIVATDGFNSIGTVTLLATIKDAVYDETTEKYSDLTKRFTVSISDVIPYVVPAAGTGYFYVDLNEFDTQTPSTAGINDVVPFVETAAGKVTVPFTGGNNQRVNFKLTDAQKDLLMGIAAVDGKKTVTVNINAVVVGTAGGSNDKFRYHIGNATSGSAWNATGSPAEGVLSTITGPQVLEFGANMSNATCKYLILQHRVADNITIEISSIRITYAATAGVTQVNVAFSAANTVAGNNGTISFADGGFTYTYGTVTDSNYGNAIVRFKADLGSAQLKDYEKVTFTWTGVSGDVASSKRLYLLASQTEADVTPWKGDAAIKALIVSDDPGDSFWDGSGPQVDGTTAQSVTLNILQEKTFTGEVWFAVYLGAADGTYTISDLKFIPK